MFTFDDGSNFVVMLRVLDALVVYGAYAIFFCIGEYLEKYFDIGRCFVDEGYELGNYSYSYLCLFNFYGVEFF